MHNTNYLVCKTPNGLYEAAAWVVLDWPLQSTRVNCSRLSCQIQGFESITSMTGASLEQKVVLMPTQTGFPTYCCCKFRPELQSASPAATHIQELCRDCRCTARLLLFLPGPDSGVPAARARTNARSDADN